MISTSSSNWLDRLRSSRGFPTGDEPDLDRFISLSSSSGSAESATHVTATEKTPKWTPPSGEFATVLSDLFNMGGDVSKQQQRKKACRKQPNPRFFNFDTELPTSSDDLRRNNNTNNHNNNTETVEKVGFNSTDDGRVNANIDSCCNNDNVGKGGDDNNNNNRLVAVVVENNEEEVENDELKEYSRSEVTVIDTSFEEWKSDKWVFRKNDDWKFKDKKKTRVKSKVSGFGSSNNNSNSKNNTNKKKRKLLVSKLGDNSNSDKKLDDEKLKEKKEDDELPNKRQPRNDKRRDSFQKRQAYLGKVPQKRFPCPRPPEKQKNEESPVILIKSIPLNDNTAAMKTGKTSQKIRPKKMKII